MRKVLILAALAGMLFAQPPPHQSVAAQAWWQNSGTVTSLNLSEAQMKSLNQIKQSYVNRLNELYQLAKKADSALEDIFNQPTQDDLKAEAAVDQYANARDNLTRELTHLSLKMRSVLTAEQWQQLENMENGRGGPRPGKGRGPRGPAPAAAPTSSNGKVGPAISQQK
jgi:Spy/CpxP family protein refolding chaperone